MPCAVGEVVAAQIIDTSQPLLRIVLLCSSVVNGIEQTTLGASSSHPFTRMCVCDDFTDVSFDQKTSHKTKQARHVAKSINVS